MNEKLSPPSGRPIDMPLSQEIENAIRKGTAHFPREVWTPTAATVSIPLDSGASVSVTFNCHAPLLLPKWLEERAAARTK